MCPHRFNLMLFVSLYFKTRLTFGIDEEPFGPESNQKKIFVNGFNPSTNEEELKSHFDQYGQIKEVKVITF